MNKIILLLFVSIMCLSCVSKKYLTLNSTIKETKADSTFIFVPNGALIKSFSIIKKNIKYIIGISFNNRLIYIGTTNENFIINGLKINDQLPECYFDKEWGYSAGWGYYIEIESGWYAGFDFQTKPNEESRIQWFFKFDFNK
jgi:hypothetical protein